MEHSDQLEHHAHVAALDRHSNNNKILIIKQNALHFFQHKHDIYF